MDESFHNILIGNTGMANVILSNVLSFVNKNIKRLDKSTLLETIGKFYHEDELYSAKLELCKYVATLMPVNDADPNQAPPTIDGWTKFVNSKGMPITRKSGDAVQRRRQEADDVLQMVMLLDVNKVELPKFVADDLDRVPGSVRAVDSAGTSTLPEVTRLIETVNGMLSKFALTMDSVIQRLDNIDRKQAVSSASLSDLALQKIDILEKKLMSLSTISNGPADSVTVSALPNPVNLDEDDGTVVGGSENTTSWAGQVKELAKADPKTMFHSKPVIRVHGRASDSSVKGVPRPLTCFAGRLHCDVTANELATYLKEQGILDAQCYKLVAKNGQVFNTSAFRVSCSPQFKFLFYDESVWPDGVELRDWVFYNNNKYGRHQ